MKYIRYEILKRRYSTNSLMGITVDDKGKEKAHFFLTVYLPKAEGDIEVEKIKNFYNGNNK
jgi:hypothetical protein